MCWLQDFFASPWEHTLLINYAPDLMLRNDDNDCRECKSQSTPEWKVVLADASLVHIGCYKAPIPDLLCCKMLTEEIANQLVEVRRSSGQTIDHTYTFLPAWNNDNTRCEGCKCMCSSTIKFRRDRSLASFCVYCLEKYGVCISSLKQIISCRANGYFT
jgi:hypothetical protein